MVVIDTHLARGASNGGLTFHDRGGPYGRTEGRQAIVAVDVTGPPVGALVVHASTHENQASALMLEHLTRQGVPGRLELVLVDRGVTAAAARTLGRSRRLAKSFENTTTSATGWLRSPASRPHFATSHAHGRRHRHSGGGLSDLSLPARTPDASRGASSLLRASKAP